ncbi:MAG: SusC/RagA family TonB-linked outer membrane protein [Flavobacteriaceae bacterium]|nr:SusC/RagA family TonB-linked outer membrane protein [Flavobacteriaceae bacterium]
MTDGDSTGIILELEQLSENNITTALSLVRGKKTLGYSIQNIDGEEINNIKGSNFINLLSGKLSGVYIKPSGTMGGSTNIIIRGHSSLVGSNQALFVVDGVIMDNSNFNSHSQQSGNGGYDYGNATSDINQEDIESISVLKGGAAFALYGSEGVNGVVMITTKKGKKSKGLGITVNSNMSFGVVDKSTYAKYQTSYGAGYGWNFYGDSHFNNIDMDGDTVSYLVVLSDESASFGTAFNPSLMVYQWDSFYPQLKGTYGVATPWEAAENNPLTFFETAVTLVNSVSFDGVTDKSNYKVGYTNFNQAGILPNSSLKKNIIDFYISNKIDDRLTFSTKLTYSNVKGEGRSGTGSSSLNVNESFRQFYQVNVDIQYQKDAYLATGDNITWNAKNYTDLTPRYFDNPYWMRYNSYEVDERNRLFGYFSLDYKVTDWLSAKARFSLDSYKYSQEERVAIGGVMSSGYKETLRKYRGENYDFFLNFDKRFLDNKLGLMGVVGSSLSRKYNSIDYISTVGGLVLPGLYSFSNSQYGLNASSSEYDSDKNSYFANFNISYDDTYYIEGSGIIEKLLPDNHSEFRSSSLSGAVVLSNFFVSDILSFTKLRFGISSVEGSVYSQAAILNNYELSQVEWFSYGGSSDIVIVRDYSLDPEKAKELELGLEMLFFKNKLGLDLSVYDKTTKDNVVPFSYSSAGYSLSGIMNNGEIRNKGVELSLYANMIDNKNFNWNINVNWSKNINKVTDMDHYISSTDLRGGVSVVAAEGEAYGSIIGTDYVYDDNGNRIIGDNGYWLKTDRNEIIGNANPDWMGGITNSFRYKNFNLSFLIDIKKGGDIFSLDTWYGYASGLYPETVFINDLGNPVRGIGGGVILTGVREDGSENDTRVSFNSYDNPLGYRHAPNSAHIYDASYVKLRELSFSYSFPEELINKIKLTSLSITATGKNLWIIHKNTPYSDPEAGLSSGNIQGYQSGVSPAVKEFGFNLKLQF